MTEKTRADRGFRALSDAQRALPKPRVATLPEGDVRYLVSGEGGPAVVLVSSFGVPHSVWALIWGELAATTTVFGYNRPGVDGSAAPQHPQTGTAVAGTLRQMLAASGLEPPYVVVAHGLGGLFAQLYARRFPQEVAGLVLLEATHPDDDVLERRLRFLPRAVASPLTARALRRGARDSELQYFPQTVAEIGASDPFPDVPLTVVTGGRAPSRLTTTAAQAERHDRRQRELVALSPRGTQIMAPHSGHLPQITDPESSSRPCARSWDGEGPDGIWAHAAPVGRRGQACRVLRGLTHSSHGKRSEPMTGIADLTKTSGPLPRYFPLSMMEPAGHRAGR